MLLLEEEESAAPITDREDSRTVRSGTVIAILPGACIVDVEGEQVRCSLATDVAAVQLSALAVGDSVSLSTVDGSQPRVEKILPRRTALSRPDPHIPERERLIAANIDVVVIVASVKSPPLRIRLIDRYLIATQRGGTRALLCLNKIDLLESEEERCSIQKMLDPYREIGVLVVSVSASTGAGLDDLRAALHGLRCVMVGRSGVGKSSILNAIDPNLDLKTAAVSEWSNKGKHTTATSVLYRLPDNIQIIDTPGIRQFGLWEIQPNELRWYFPEFEPWTSACRFGDCTHTNEPACAVRQAAEEGRFAAQRYDTYLRILATLGR